jgi:putative spermidine/putrescine transport system substrate-binding protein
MTSRRNFVKLAGYGALALPWHGATFAQGSGNVVTVTSLGGKWEQSIREHFIPVFKRKTGADVRIVLGAPPQWVSQIEAQPKKPPLDAIDNSESLAISLIDKGMVLKLTPEKVPNLVDIPEICRLPFDNYGASYQYSTSGLFYNSEKIKQAPASWAEFFERAGRGEFGKTLTLADISYTWGPHMLWHFNKVLGGDLKNLDPVFTALRKIKPYVVKFWGTALEVERMALSKEVNLGVLWDGRAQAMQDTNAPFLRFTRLAPDSLLTLTPAQVVKGGNEALAFEWVNTLLDPQPQLEYYKLIGFTPTNTKVKIPDNLKSRVPDLKKTATPPYRELMAAIPAIMDRWNREIRV